MRSPRVYLVLFLYLIIHSPFAYSEQDSIDTAAPDWAMPAPLAYRSMILDVTQAGSRQVAVGERGHILYSDDCGGNWQQAKVPTRTTLTAVFFIDDKRGWAVGHDSVVLKTGDGGENWRITYQDAPAEQPLFDIWFRNSRQGIAIGAYGAFIISNDGGETWQSSPVSDEDFHLYSITPFADDNLLIAGEAGSLYRSTDAGRSWQKLVRPYVGSFFGVLSLSRSSLLVYGMRGHVFRSDDGGDSWKQVDVGVNSSLEGGYRQPGGNIYLAGHNGVILKSTNQGNSFSPIQAGNRRNYAALSACSNGDLIVVGESGVEKLTP
ncbi:MAG: YCF48-related protein [Gammaproteobacteria bacterium]|nr:MAG: YCF48-related protein [Gammaproteobacteria bacterium]